MPQKMIRVGAVMAHQSAQGRAVALPVMHAQGICCGLVQLQVLLQVRRHAAVDVRKDMRRRIMQRVVQIKNPNSLHPFRSKDLAHERSERSWDKVANNGEQPEV